MISTAFAMGAGEGGQAAGGLAGFLPIIILFAIFYFLLIRPPAEKSQRTPGNDFKFEEREPDHHFRWHLRDHHFY